MREFQPTQMILNKSLLQAQSSMPIKKVCIALGEISELDPKLILQQWQELSKGTRAEHAQLQFRLIKAEVQCMSCFGKYHPLDGKIHCPSCGSYGAKVLSGEECHLESIEFDHE